MPKEFKKVRFGGRGHRAAWAWASSRSSKPGTERLVRAAIDYALRFNRKSVNIVHKGNIMKFTEGAFRDWGYALAQREYRDQIVTQRESWIIDNVDRNAGH